MLSLIPVTLTDPSPLLGQIELWERRDGMPLSFSRRLPNNSIAKFRLPLWLGKVSMTGFTETTFLQIQNEAKRIVHSNLKMLSSFTYHVVLNQKEMF